ncbi:hypothetical protein NDU88_004862 [Pleurodeles waltl]|uniref:Uncharacterized protein n=1 Tax=Pleurodeles waltl TaxID=8319 RepID=A0AAV7V2X1_PLEWA|nr:hypothetical protein NDU88_004862 [Pleurodeles waltl]
MLLSLSLSLKPVGPFPAPRKKREQLVNFATVPNAEDNLYKSNQYQKSLTLTLLNIYVHQRSLILEKCCLRTDHERL